MLENAQAATEMIGRDLGAGGEWESIAIVAGEDARISVIHLSFANPEEKEKIFSKTLPRALQKARAKAVVLVLPSWVSRTQGKMPDVSPSEDPHRQEILVLMGATAEHVDIRIAEIQRQSGRPRLQDWQKAEDAFGGTAASMGGAILERLIAALAGIRASQN